MACNYNDHVTSRTCPHLTLFGAGHDTFCQLCRHVLYPPRLSSFVYTLSSLAHKLLMPT